MLNIESKLLLKPEKYQSLSTYDDFQTMKTAHMNSIKIGYIAKDDNPSVISTKTDFNRDLKINVLWLLSTLGFSVIIYFYKGLTSSIQFINGYVLEQCLSIDNLFVFIICFNYFGITKEYQDRILTYGLYGAAVMRGIFIAVGFAILQKFQYVLLVFAVLLLFSSFKILTKKEVLIEDNVSLIDIL